MSNQGFNNSKASSRASSFDPFDYYKKLTQCLAKRKSCQLDLRKIPGAQQINKPVKPLITKQYLTAQFLAKYDRKQQTSSESKSASQRGNSQGKASQKEKLNFNVKAPNAGPSKRKKEQEYYINLPASFFNSFNGQDMSIFKIPEVPPPRKVAKAPDAPTSIVDMTLNSIRSAAFKPNPENASTPLEKLQPIFSDPDEILRNLKDLKKPKEVVQGNLNDEKAEKFMELVGRTAMMIDDKCFANQPDPIEDIRSRVMKIYEFSCQSPRLINETLMSSIADASKTLASKPAPKASSSALPVPELFDDAEKKIQKDNSEQQSQQHFDFTPSSELVDWSPKLDKLIRCLETPDNIVDQDISAILPLGGSEWNFDSPVVSTSSNSHLITPTFLLETPQSLFSCETDFDDDAKFFDFSPSALDDLTFSFEPSDFPSSPTFDSSFAIFRSPPKPRASQFRVSSSQQLNDCFSCPSDSSLSTYQWTPNVQNITLTNQSLCSSAYPFMPRNIFQNSFDLL